MTIRPRIVFIGLALAALTYGGTLGLYHVNRFDKLRVLDDVCTVDGEPITGNDFDDFGQLCVYRAQNEAIAKSGQWPEVVAIGDSLTANWPEADKRIAYRGVGGQTTTQILLRFRQDVIANHPRIVHLLAGTNDISGLTGPVTLPQIEGNLLTMIELARLHGATVILGTIPPMGSYNGVRPGEPGQDVARLNALIRDIANREKLILADYNAATSTAQGEVRPDFFYNDKVHLTPAGYEAMQATFDKALAQARAARVGKD